MPPLASYGNGLSHTGVNTHMPPPNLWGTNDLTLIKSDTRQKFLRFCSPTRKTKRAAGRKYGFWAIWISKINGSGVQICVWRLLAATGHHHTTAWHCVTGLPPLPAPLKDLNQWNWGERDAWEKLMEFFTSSVGLMRTPAPSSNRNQFFLQTYCDFQSVQYL